MEPLSGIVLDFPEEEYHAHPALSSTGAKTLVKDSPAMFKHAILDGNKTYKKAFDVGHAIHAKVLGVGMGVIEIPEKVLSKAGSIGTDAARAFIAEKRTEGLVPLKKAEIAEVNKIADSVLTHPLARDLFERDGTSEATAFAHDEEHGIDLRARFDRISGNDIVDLKSAADASPRGFAKNVQNFRYDIQQEFYRDVYQRSTGEPFGRFWFVAVETTAPYGVGVYDLDALWELVARADVAKAKRLYRSGLDTGNWPSYSDDPVTLTPPIWMLNEHDQGMVI